ncbi:MAG: HEAT repeat domain-containing protein [Gemmatimonadetes bacterium]|nr:HEAT repeat domain-containing protein [Gemmatimonadota bacterium]MXY80765.1 HEAT repeat domain-containing protein [Gemmatimonadota bacterium]MYB70351.1 HEAT repeat domain-containing protein [Gemmatimonadota bacterium]
MVGLFVKNQKIGSRLALGALLAGASLGLACGGPTPEEYIQQFKSRQKAERVKAANQLIRFDADEVVPLLTEEADSGYIRVRFEVIQLLGRFKDERAVPTLIAALRDKSPRVAAAAAWALGEIGSPAALAPLLKYARDPTVEVRQYVLGALGSCHSYEAEPTLSDSAFRVVRRALRAPKPKWRVAALQSLRAYGYRDAVEEVIRMSVDPSNEVRYVAVQALGQIGSAALRRPGPARNAIYEALLVALDADELQSIRSKAMHALAEMGDKRAEPHLQQLMRAGTEEDQTAARLALYKLSPEVAEAMRQTELGAR